MSITMNLHMTTMLLPCFMNSFSPSLKQSISTPKAMLAMVVIANWFVRVYRSIFSPFPTDSSIYFVIFSATLFTDVVAFLTLGMLNAGVTWPFNLFHFSP